ncbi:hypothetical protein [Rufibacter hautae]|uniref:Outer membrane protein beta-barrel domain-containing protein n=1 Tax=Rufibacter hautae TaxID=2595005 RepID=A0A5B6TDE2_9BACT|nr:hypothetical protein [Rufibacter hautae]KAA3436999.1 hypothetical protein FOA19_21740 [Rufibacter hautae]
MKAAVSILCLVLFSALGWAQDTTKVVRYFGQLGAMIPIDAEATVVVGGSLLRESKKQQVWAVRVYSTEYYEPGYGPKAGRFGKDQPKHYINELNISFGKVRYLRKDLAFSFTAGPSLVLYEMPTNVNAVRSGWGIITGTTYEYDIKKYLLPGLSGRGEMILCPYPTVGISLGGEYHLSRKVTYAGFLLNLMLGRFQPKKPLDSAPLQN